MKKFLLVLPLTLSLFSCGYTRNPNISRPGQNTSLQISTFKGYLNREGSGENHFVTTYYDYESNVSCLMGYSNTFIVLKSEINESPYLDFRAVFEPYMTEAFCVLTLGNYYYPDFKIEYYIEATNFETGSISNIHIADANAEMDNHLAEIISSLMESSANIAFINAKMYCIDHNLPLLN